MVWSPQVGDSLPSSEVTEKAPCSSLYVNFF